ncbi:SpaA isopeptide-forming pilin-related protein [Listeria monocytogenes]
MYKNKKVFQQWLTSFLVVIVFLSAIFTPLGNVLATETNNSLPVSPNNEVKTAAEEAALKKGLPINGQLRALKAGSATVTYKGQVSYGGSTVGHFEIGGEQAFCIEHPKPTPGTNTPNDGGNIYNNAKVAATLYYGITGDKNIFGSDWARGTVLTSLILSEMYLGSYQGGSSIAGYDQLKAKAVAGDYPNEEVKFSKTTLKSFVSGDVQKTETGKFEGDNSNYVVVPLDSKVTMYNVTKGTKSTGGNIRVYGGDSFYLTAPLDYDSDFGSGALKGSMKGFSPILYKMNDGSLQKLVKAGWYDPTDTVSFTAKFEAQVGDLKIKKNGSDNRTLANAEYDVKDSSGKVVAHVKTGSDGTVTAKDLLMGDYTVVETKAPAGYTIDNTVRKVTVKAAETTLLNVTNKAISFQVKVKKTDAETGDTAQGDASLVGAKYGIYEDAAATKLVDEITIGQDLTATSKKMLLGGASKTVYVKETKAPLGYNIDPTIHAVKVDQKDDVTELLLGNAASKETVIKGGFELIKFANKPLLQSTVATLPEGQKQALEGAEFTATLKSTGVVAQTQTTDLNGAANFQNLPYGTYVVRETKTPTGYKAVADFEVTISEEGQQFHYILEDKVVEAKVKIVKKDIETGKVIPLAGATFKVKDSEGNFLTQHVNYPSDKDITEFVTAADGTLVLPETLVYGDYTLVEVKAPNGYLLNKEEIPFTVNADNDGKMITLDFSDAPAKGKVQGIKTKEVIDTEKSTQDQVVYKQVAAPNIEFDVVAKENIVTPDGTIRAKQGEVVDHLKTNAEGAFESNKSLYLGEYQLVETNVPSEYRELKPVSFSLRYQDDQTEIVWANLNVKNILKKGEVEVSKKDITGDKELPGATLNIKGKEIDVTWVSTNQAKKYTLPEGEYTLTEKIPNNGYQLNTTAVKFTVKDGQVTKTVMHNEKIPTPVKKGFLPTTGDSSLDLMLYSFGTILVAVGIYLLVQTRKKHAHEKE